MLCLRGGGPYRSLDSSRVLPHLLNATSMPQLERGSSQAPARQEGEYEYVSASFRFADMDVEWKKLLRERLDAHGEAHENAKHPGPNV